jgi:hypothetical protein
MKNTLKIINSTTAAIMTANGNIAACPYSPPIPTQSPSGLLGKPGQIEFSRAACGSDCPLFQIKEAETTDLAPGVVVLVSTCQKDIKIKCS